MSGVLEVSKEEMQSWRENKITQYMLSELRDTQEDLKNYIADGGTLLDDSTAEWVGKIKGIDQVFHVISETGDDYAEN